MWKQTAQERREITGHLRVRDLSASASAFAPFHYLSTNVSLCTNTAHHHQTIFQLSACVHALMHSHVLVYVGCVSCLWRSEKGILLSVSAAM